VAVIAIVEPLNMAAFWAEIPRASLTLAVGVLLTGGVASLLAAHNRAVEERRNDHDLRLQLVQQLREAHNKVKTAALLINASRSVNMYGQQMQELLVARVSLLDVEWAVRSRPRLCGGGDRVELVDKFLHSASHYLEAIGKEYAEQYGRVCAIQLFSSKWDEKKAEEMAPRRVPPVTAEMALNPVPWQELTRKETFPRLTELRLDTEDHNRGFSEPVNKAIRIIVDEDERTRRPAQADMSV
jgi:hypothetical protein